MSTQDEINISDADFDAFLKGEGELSLMLRQLPQKQPSAELDDAILAKAKVELAKTPEAPVVATVQSAPQAANDPVMPGKSKSSGGFVSRWRIPLGLVASLFVTVQLVRMEIYDERMKPGAPALLVEKVPAPIAEPVESRVIAEPSVDVKIVPPPGYELPQGISAKPEAPPSATTAAIQAAQATAAAASQPVEKKKQSHVALQEESRLAAPKPAPQAAPVAAAPAPVQDAPLSFAAPAPTFNYAEKKATTDTGAAQTSGFGLTDNGPASMPNHVIGGLYAQEPMHAANPSAAAPVVAARAMAQPPASAPARAIESPDQSVQRVEITGANLRRADKETASSADVISRSDIRQSADTSEADTWLVKIDGLLKSGSTPQALEEWHKFRRAYPDYKVPDQLRAKIDALLNQQTLESGSGH